MKTLTNYRGYVILSLLYALGLGGYVLYDRWPRPAPIIITQPTPVPTATTTPIPTPAPMRVHVVGAVRQPGVYAVEPASRLIEAVVAAGGLATDADEERVNLAEPLYDGQQVYIPRIGTPVPPSPTPSRPTPSPTQAALALITAPQSAAPQAAAPQAAAAGAKININTASLAELDTLPGIGPAYAQRIIDYRETYGPFTDISQITEVNGIGPVTFERLQGLIVVE
ncbi:MAG: ComEA family DNA-binding protein [Chloroflexi bacterium]|jgi:competence protein ComEA|nr:ComEA family DNA-binding protein [Chloroflexota bacterium]